MQQDAVNSLKDSLLELERNYRNAQTNLEKCKQALVRHERQERELQIEVQKADDLVEQLKEAIEKDNVEDGRLEGLKAGIAESEEDMRVAEASYEDGINANDVLIEKLKGLRRELAAKDAEIASAEGKVRGLEREESKASAARRKALGEKNAAIGRVEDVQRDKIETEHKREQAAARVLNFSEKASMVASRVAIDATETASSLDRKLEKLTQDLQQYDRQYVIPNPFFFIGVLFLLFPRFC